MKKRSPARGGAGNAEQMGNLHRHSTATRNSDTARPNVGEIVEVNGLAGRFVVVSNSDPAIVILRNDRGVELRVGERQIVRLGEVE